MVNLHDKLVLIFFFFKMNTFEVGAVRGEMLMGFKDFFIFLPHRSL